MIIDNNEIVLRPRFKVLVKTNHLILIEKFKELKKEEHQKYISRVVQNYILLDIPAEENHFWSPQLEIRIDQKEENTAEVCFLYGPKAIVWTFFMFLHFIVAGIFFVFFVITYANYTLDKPFKWPLSICISMVLLWILLYLLGRIGKKLAKKQIQELHNYFNQVLRST